MILTIAGSNSKSSINQEVARRIAEMMNIDYFDSREIDIPIYNRDNNVSGEIVKLYDLLLKYTKIIFVLPEYNGNFSSFFKNIIDELSIYKRDFLNDKKIFVVCATPGGLGGKSVISVSKNTFPHFGAEVVQTYGIAKYQDMKTNLVDIENIVKDIQEQISNI